MLGATVAAGVAYVRALTDAGVPLATAFGQIELQLPASADQFATIALFRAVRQLWGRVAEVLDVPRRGEQDGHPRHHVAGDAHRLRPVGQPAARHRRLLRRRRRRRRLDHRAPVRRVDRSPRPRARPPAGAQHPVDPRARVEPRARRRSRRRFGLRRGAHRRPRRRRVGVLPGDRGGRRVRRRGRQRLARRALRRHLGGTGAQPRHPQGPDHRRVRVPQHRRAGAGDPAERRHRGPARCTAVPSGSRTCAPPSTRRRPPASDHGVPRGDRHPGAVDGADHVRQELLRGRRHPHDQRAGHDRPGGDRRGVHRVRGDARPACARAIRPTPSTASPSPTRCRQPAPSGSTSPAGPAT